MRRALAGLLILSSAAVASAQSAPPNDRAVDIQLFEPALGTHAFLTVNGAEVMARGQLQLALGVNYMTHPLSVFVVDKMDNLSGRSEVVKSVFTGNLSFAYGVAESLQAGVLLPVILSMTGDGLDSATGMPQAGGLSVSGLGDARLEAIWRAYRRSRMVVALIPAVTVPTSVKLGSGEDAFLGDDLPSFRPRIAFEYSTPDERFSAGANLGAILRKKREIYSSVVGQQLTYGVAGTVRATRRVEIIAEIFGRKGMGNDLDESPLEGDLALRIAATPSLTVQAGGGAGLVEGFGAPQARVFASVAWAPDYRDDDHDGIANMNDKCPNQAEDKDGFQDEDGCPDPDNDGDGIPDAQDSCPDVREDLDGFQDEDGCPDPDNDGDGIPDEKDACPDDAEDKLPPRPDDGCPVSKIDSDGDGVPDNLDKCPNEPEDVDGFQDDDGCPDPDNDGDGIADADDKCPLDPEDKEGFEDDDGCPEGGARAPAKLQGHRMVLTTPLAFDGARVRSASLPVLDQAALLIRVNRDVGRWKVSVAAPKAKQAQDRADAIKAYLVKKGVAATAVEAVGTQGKPAVGIVATQKADGTPIPQEEPEPTIEIEPQ